MERLASVGIGKTMAARIARQFKQFGADQGGLRIANTEQWTDTEAVMAFRAAVARETDKIVVTPGVGDRPLVVSSLLRSEEHTSELQSLMRISYAVFCLKKKNHQVTDTICN